MSPGRSARRGRGGRAKPRIEKRQLRDLSRPVEELSWRLEDPALGGARLDRFLGVCLPWRSRTSIVTLLDEGQVQLNGEVTGKKATRLRLGDQVSVRVPPPEEEVRHAELAQELEAAILFEDPDLVVLAKPAGMVVHPVGRIRVNTMVQALHWLYRHQRKEPQVIPRICHRLDRETSGVLVVAKSYEIRRALQLIFDRHALRKEYLALLEGRLAPGEGRIEAPLGPAPDAPLQLMMAVREDGVPARTDYQVLERFPQATLVRFRLHTGRQHQIRVHAQSLGHPVLLDALYGSGARAWPREGEPLLQRQALHAQRLVFTHPRSGQELDLRAELPSDFSRLLLALRAGEA